MGQVTRQMNYNRFWSWVEPSIDGYSASIDMMLRMLTDNQLDELITEISDADGFGENDD